VTACTGKLEESGLRLARSCYAVGLLGDYGARYGGCRMVRPSRGFSLNQEQAVSCPYELQGRVS
jgi:hypothetical protein